ncbi:beta-ketoacyl-ACP synthase II [Schlesneria sp.]|uniref:beta-ketoacyl-ACP synthase II n=1 Tax=Schlesneria sp. TaxID=2762018 RepID=UPI002F1886C7
MEMRRAVITGLGTVNPLANNMPDFWKAVCDGQSAVGRISRFDASNYRTRIAAEVKNFQPDEILGGKQAKRLDRYAQYGLVAAIEALKDAGLDPTSGDPRRAAVVVGTGIGGMEVFEEESIKLQHVGPGRVSPFFVPRIMPNAAAAAISIHFGVTGPCFSVSSACASAADAISTARDLIRTGRSDIVITGGAEAPITPLGLAGFCAARSLSERNDAPTQASRPFDRGRDGFVLGEGAGILVLEDYEHALHRGARIYCEIVGYGQTADAHHMTAPNPSGAGAAEAMRAAMQDAHVMPEQIPYINAHATSTELGDAAEATAIRTAFGERAADRLSISCTKSLIGHLCGASGSVAAAVIAMSIRDGVIHPTLNFDEPSEEWLKKTVHTSPVDEKIRMGMLNSFGFGGHNSSIILAAVEN